MDHYEIIVKGHIDQRRARWFEGMSMAQLPDGRTELAGLVDQSALHAVLNRIRDLGLPLLMVRQVNKEVL